MVGIVGEACVARIFIEICSSQSSNSSSSSSYSSSSLDLTMVRTSLLLFFLSFSQL